MVKFRIWLRCEGNSKIELTCNTEAWVMSMVMVVVLSKIQA